MRKGFTLIEVMAALAILGIAMAMLVSASTRSLGRVADARQMVTAGALAQAKMAELVLTGPPKDAEESAWAPMDTSDLSLHPWWRKRVEVQPVVPGKADAQDPDTLRMLEVSVRLSADEKDPVYRLATLFPAPVPPAPPPGP